MIEANVIHPKQYNINIRLGRIDNHLRLIASFANLFVDTASTTVNGTVLRRHDRLDSTFRLDVASKPRNFWDDNDDL
jgi:hypothetical protein